MSEQVNRPLQLFSRQKLDEFRSMSLRSRLQWLEEANILMIKALGRERLARIDNRFQET